MLRGRTAWRVKNKTEIAKTNERGGWNIFARFRYQVAGPVRRIAFMFRADDVNAMTRQNYLRAASVAKKRAPAPVANKGAQFRGGQDRASSFAGKYQQMLRARRQRWRFRRK